LRLSEGHPGTALWSNLVAAVLYLPAIILLTPAYGVMAPAVLWLVANAFLYAVLLARAHRDALARYAWPWVWACVIPQFTVTAAVYAMTKAVLPQASSPVVVAAVAVVAAGVGFAVSVAVSGDLRHSVVSFIRRSRLSAPGVRLAR
jgi:hypothetical protein